MNKTVKIGPLTYKMYQASTGWVFVKGTNARTKNSSYSVAKIVNEAIVVLDDEDALGTPTNAELAHAWINS